MHSLHSLRLDVVSAEIVVTRVEEKTEGEKLHGIMVLQPLCLH